MAERREEAKRQSLSPFEKFVRAIAGVPKSELREAEEGEKREKERKRPKTA